MSGLESAWALETPSPLARHDVARLGRILPTRSLCASPLLRDGLSLHRRSNKVWRGDRTRVYACWWLGR